MRLEVVQVSKSFGTNKVLKNISISAQSGMAMGLLGRNGAGKTTTIRIIMNVFPADQGKIMIDGQPLRPDRVSIGYLPEEKGLYPKFKIGDQLVYLGQLRGLSRKAAVSSVENWLERLSLTETMDKKLETLSKGNQQKIQLALALLADPEIVILDEPFSGLDPVNAQLLKTIVREQVDAGKIVLFSSHQMSYVEQFCDQVALLDQGQIIMQGNLRQIKREHARNKVYVSLSGGAEATIAQIRQLMEQDPQLNASISQLAADDDGCLLHLEHESERLHLFQLLSDHKLRVEQFRIAEPSLEDIFVEKVGEKYEEQAV